MYHWKQETNFSNFCFLLQVLVKGHNRTETPGDIKFPLFFCCWGVYGNQIWQKYVFLRFNQSFKYIYLLPLKSSFLGTFLLNASVQTHDLHEQQFYVSVLCYSFTLQFYKHQIKAVKLVRTHKDVCLDSNIYSVSLSELPHGVPFVLQRKSPLTVSYFKLVLSFLKLVSFQLLCVPLSCCRYARGALFLLPCWNVSIYFKFTQTIFLKLHLVCFRNIVLS